MVDFINLFENSLSCYFYYSNSTIDLDVNPVGLDRYFQNLSNSIKFTKFGQVYLEIFKFEFDTSIEF
jgi:hypothetical protein